MCGIAGFIDPTLLETDRKTAIRAMNTAQERRGPDDEGIMLCGKATLGHQRLSILDLSSAGHQPMKRSQYSIVFNGEIYNFHELRQQLVVKGYEFSTNTDTEVILALFEAYKTDSFKKLEGMFAFTLWDATEEKLYLVRDRFGIKPLYYFKNKESLIFASTVKAIKASGLVPEKENIEALIGFLLFGSVPEPFTTLEQTRMLPAGHYAMFSQDKLKIFSYADILEDFQKTHTEKSEEVTHITRQLLEKSVKSHLVSDAPLGVFLSGGVDSSVLAVLAAQHKNQLTTLSIDFEESEFSERPYQDIITQQIGSDHQRIVITKKDFLEELDIFFSAMDQPTIDGLNTFMIAKAAKQAGLKAVLSGLGGDEVFAGYPSFQKIHILYTLQQLPRALKLPLIFGGMIKPAYKKLGYIVGNHTSWYAYLALRGLFMPHKVQSILSVTKDEIQRVLETLASEAPPITPNLPAINWLSYMELTYYMRNQLLRDSDVFGMYHGVEIRVPFLDNNLVSFVSGLDSSIKIKKNEGKWLLKESIKQNLPQSILERKKMGFTFPFQKWLANPHKQWTKSWGIEVLKRTKG